ncbi:MAG: BLUF domain-containing protein [Roseicyclus sp.]
MIWRVAYISERCATDDDLVDLLAEARARNASEDVTGVLLADRSHFVQAIEGARPAIADLTLRLMGDPRHTGMRFLASGPDEVRWFSDWKMALVVPGPRAASLKKRFGAATFESQVALFETFMASVDRAEAVPTGLVQYG